MLHSTTIIRKLRKMQLTNQTFGHARLVRRFTSDPRKIILYSDIVLLILDKLVKVNALQCIYNKNNRLRYSFTVIAPIVFEKIIMRYPAELIEKTEDYTKLL